MTSQGLATLIVRIAGIFLGLYALQNGIQYASIVLEQGQPGQTMWVTLAIQVMMLCIAIAMFSWPHVVVGNTTVGAGTGKETPSLPIGDIEVLAASLLGMYFVFDALLDGVHILALREATARNEIPWRWQPEHVAIIAAASAQFVLGLWLIFGAKGLIAIMTWARRTTTKQPN